MKKAIILIAWLLPAFVSVAQPEQQSYTAFAQHMEIQNEGDDLSGDDDSYLQQLEYFRKHPLNLNKADEDEFKGLLLLSDLQIRNLIIYRGLFGKLVSIYELQAVPSWDIHTIALVLPYITVTEDQNLVQDIRSRWTDGEHLLLVNASQVLEKARGFLEASPGLNQYPGSRARLYARYKYNYKNLLQWGVLGDKDPGEQFFRGSQKTGFDFYSFHLFARKLGIVKSVAVGDFTVNMGQGLIQWESAAFKKSSEITAVKRQSATLNPYSSAGESNFHRGLGITFQKKLWEATIFISRQKISGNMEKDSVNDAGHISSLLSSGYHRTLTELEDKNNVRQFSAGASIRYSRNSWLVSLNAVHYRFSLPILKQDKPYNLFALKGNAFTNLSFDYSHTYKNIHFFGEAAVDKNRNAAFVNGILISMASMVDASLVHRSVSRHYQAVYADAFTENSTPSNEKGLFAGISVRPGNLTHIEAYADVFKFPWLKYRVDAPSWGKDYLIAFTYVPNKQVEISTRYRVENKQLNRPGASSITPVIDNICRQNWRVHSEIVMSRLFTVRSRCELSWYRLKGSKSEQGFLVLTDLFYKPPLKPWSGNFRLMYFETQGYNARLYAYENDVLYNFSVPAFFDKGVRYYLNLHTDLSALFKIRTLKKAGTECWLRFAQTLYAGKNTISSGLDELKGNRKTEIRLSLYTAFNPKN